MAANVPPFAQLKWAAQAPHSAPLVLASPHENPRIGGKIHNFYKIQAMSLTQRSPLASAYLRFLQLARAVEALPDGGFMDANESALLEAVVLRWHEDRPMTVREAINLSSLGSPATLHKRITRLRQKDMLTTFSEPGDRRAKFLIPTQQALDYFHHLGQSMQQVQSMNAA